MRNRPFPRRRWLRPSRRPAARAGLLALVLLLGPAAAPLASAEPGWAWPLAPRPAVVGDWAPPAERWGRGHRGVDLGAVAGAAVRAPEDGTVSFVGFVVDRPVVTIDHGGGLRSSFEPVGSALVRGERVRRGQVVGVLRGRDHCGPGACLHWGVRRGDDYLNPLQFVGALEPSVLLPVPERLRTAAQPSSF
ncbi:peptidoglycan DD-metalloendopeptidase family protein [Kocuria kalidii]|uniref:M23 family metallopeptidase n=1 Tax=Kocuria kalidii TaxID=3376283 RepID=UPI0037A25F20